jgi:hypothetical protein
MFANLHRGAKLAALVATGVVTLGGVAAATGTLPGPAQGAAHDAFGAAGIQVPDGGSGGTGSAADSTTTTTTVDPTTSTSDPSGGHSASAAGSENPRGPDATGPAKHGLCTAYAAGQGGQYGKKHESTAFRALESAATGAGQSVDEFCADATPGGKAQPDATTVTTTTTESGDVGTTLPTQPASTNVPAPGPGNPSSHGANANHGASAGAHGNSHHG